MGKFDDEIRKKLQEGEMEFNPSHWDQMSKSLSDQPPLSQFEEKIKDTLSQGSAAVPPNSWNDFSNNFNSLDSFEKGLKEKLDNGSSDIPQNSWENFSEKLADSNLSPFEKGVKTTLNNGKAKYNHKHWKALERQLHGFNTKKFMFRAAASLLLLFSIGYGVNHVLKSDSNKESNFKPTFKQKANSQFNSSQKNSALNLNNESGTHKNVPNSFINNIQDSKVNDSKSLNVNNSKDNDSPANYIHDKPSPKKVNHTPNADKTVRKGNYPTNSNVVEHQKAVEKLEGGNNDIFAINKRVELCSPIELITGKVFEKEKPVFEKHIHPGASLWLNFWDNPAITGIYGKNNISAFYHNDWEFVDNDKDLVGEFDFIQPIVYLGAYERRINKHVSIGGYYKYLLKKNWNNREINLSGSYSKKLLNDFDVKVGVSATLHNQNLAVNRLTLREKALNDDYIFTTELGSLKSRQEYHITYHAGAFVNHPNFFVGYTGFNISSQTITNEEEVFILKHSLIGGIHSPILYKFQASALLKYEQDLFKTYSPSIGITYNDGLFVAYEFEDQIRDRVSVGYNYKNKIKAQMSFACRRLDELQKEQLNLDNFTERQGYINAGINWSF